MHIIAVPKRGSDLWTISFLSNYIFFKWSMKNDNFVIHRKRKILDPEGKIKEEKAFN
jgi:hypothetical protein